MRFAVALVLPLVSLVCSCGAPRETPVTHAAPSAKPKCAPGSDDMPSDARAKMAGMQGAVRKCYSLGVGGGGETDVKVEVTVAESGKVRDAKVVGASGHPTAVECLKKTLSGAHFTKFCGPDVSISWTYALR